MKPKRATLAVLVCIVAAIGLFSFRSRYAEPSYAGKSLSQWLQVYEESGSCDPDEPDAAQAIRAIGTKAIPFLIHWICYHEPKWKEQARWLFNRSVGRFQPSWMIADTTQLTQSRAHFGFRVLGPSAASAVPALHDLMMQDDQTTRVLAAMSLGGVGKPALPVLLEDLKTDNEQVFYRACIALREMRTNAEPAIPILIAALDDSREAVRYSAAMTLGQLHLRPEVVVPALIPQLQKGKDSLSVLYALGEFGPAAGEAVPLIVPLLDNSNDGVRDRATRALREIAPQALTNAPPQ